MPPPARDNFWSPEIASQITASSGGATERPPCPSFWHLLCSLTRLHVRGRGRESMGALELAYPNGLESSTPDTLGAPPSTSAVIDTSLELAASAAPGADEPPGLLGIVGRH